MRTLMTLLPSVVTGTFALVMPLGILVINTVCSQDAFPKCSHQLCASDPTLDVDDFHDNSGKNPHDDGHGGLLNVPRAGYRSNPVLVWLTCGVRVLFAWVLALHPEPFVP